VLTGLLLTGPTARECDAREPEVDERERCGLGHGSNVAKEAEDPVTAARFFSAINESLTLVKSSLSKD